MICSTLISSRLGKENPCYTQIRLQKIQILVIRELHNEWLQCGLKQMVMKYLDPKADLTFKKIFGDHPARLISLLNALQSLSEEELIQQQQYLPTVEELENSGFTDAELRAYDKFWDSVSVERTLLDDRYQKGMTQRSLEIARKMLAKGMDEAMVMEITGVSTEQIKHLKEET